MDESWSVWWGCLQCYNDGELVGEWIELAKDGNRNSWWGQLNRYAEGHQAAMYAEDAGYWGSHEEWLPFDNGQGVGSEFINEIFEVLEARQKEEANAQGTT